MELYDRYPALRSCRSQIEEAVALLTGAFQNGGKLLLCGNGGSCADCDHVVGELMKGFLAKRPVLVPDGWNDDKEAAHLFEKLQGALPAISLPSQAAVISAYANDVAPGNSLLDSLCTVTIKVPETETYRIQELHLPVYHNICAKLEEYFFSS